MNDDQTICVITAGPAAGKTSTLRELNARGYFTSPEAARCVIDQYISTGGTAEEVRSKENFQQMIADKQRQIISNIPDDEDVVFMDRSIADGLVFGSMYDEQEYLEELEDEARDRYDFVFRLEQLPFEEDYARTESPEEAEEIHDRLRDKYQELGYNVIDIPLSTVERRADTIEDIVLHDR